MAGRGTGCERAWFREKPNDTGASRKRQQGVSVEGSQGLRPSTLEVEELVLPKAFPSFPASVYVSSLIFLGLSAIPFGPSV